MLATYFTWADDFQRKENDFTITVFITILSILLVVVSLPFMLIRFTVFRPLMGLTAWVILGAVFFGVVLQQPMMVMVYMLAVLLVGYFCRKYLADWRYRVLTASFIRSHMDAFYEGSSTSKLIKVRDVGVPGSVRVDFVTPHGKTDDQLMKQLPSLASALHTVRFIPLDLDEREGFVSVLFSFTDPLLAHLDSSNAPVLHLVGGEPR